jgi:polyadenylate-binding protein
VVKFTTETEAKNAIEKLNNKEIENKKLFVKEYQYKHHHKYNNNYNNYNNYNNFYKRNNYAQNFLYQNININNINIPMTLPKYEEQIENNNLYIKNIPFEATEEDLRKTFESFGKITSIKLEEDTSIKQDTKENDKKKFINKSFGYISFDKVEEAKKALEELQGKQLKGFETWFKPLIIEYFIPKIKRQNFNFPNFTPPPLMYPSVMIPMPTPMNPMSNFKIRNQPNFRGRKNFFRGRGQFKGNKNFYTRKNNNTNNNNLNEKEKTIKFDYDNFNKIKTDEEKKDFLGEKLYELISENQLIKTKKANEEIIGKITGMIMDIPNEEIIEILKKPKLLDSRIEEALKLIESNQ